MTRSQETPTHSGKNMERPSSVEAQEARVTLCYRAKFDCTHGGKKETACKTKETYSILLPSGLTVIVKFIIHKKKQAHAQQVDDSTDEECAYNEQRGNQWVYYGVRGEEGGECREGRVYLDARSIEDAYQNDCDDGLDPEKARHFYFLSEQAYADNICTLYRAGFRAFKNSEFRQALFESGILDAFSISGCGSREAGTVYKASWISDGSKTMLTPDEWAQCCRVNTERHTFISEKVKEYSEKHDQELQRDFEGIVGRIRAEAKQKFGFGGTEPAIQKAVKSMKDAGWNDLAIEEQELNEALLHTLIISSQDRAWIEAHPQGTIVRDRTIIDHDDEGQFDALNITVNFGGKLFRIQHESLRSYEDKTVTIHRVMSCVPEGMDPYPNTIHPTFEKSLETDEEHED